VVCRPWTGLLQRKTHVADRQWSRKEVVSNTPSENQHHQAKDGFPVRKSQKPAEDFLPKFVAFWLHGLQHRRFFFCQLSFRRLAMFLVVCGHISPPSESPSEARTPLSSNACPSDDVVFENRFFLRVTAERWLSQLDPMGSLEGGLSSALAV
jgi:hypothetical protein